MVRRTDDVYGRLRGPRVLNPTLYSRLGLAFGKVEVSNEGEPATFGGVRCGKYSGRVMVTRGEYYKLSCPYCPDRRFRLYVHHLWCQPDPLTGEPMRHLAHCFNNDCLKQNYGDFERRVMDVWGSEARAMLISRASVRRRPAIEEGEGLRPIGPVPPPGRRRPARRAARRPRGGPLPGRPWLRPGGARPRVGRRVRPPRRRRLARPWPAGSTSR